MTQLRLEVLPGLRKAYVGGDEYPLIAHRTVNTFTPVGELSGLQVQYFVACGGNAHGHIGCWVYVQHGVPAYVNGGEPEMLDYEEDDARIKFF